MINFTIAIRFRIAVIAAVLSLSTLAAEACSCASAGPGGCQVPVADIIVRATAKNTPSGNVLISIRNIASSIL